MYGSEQAACDHFCGATLSLLVPDIDKPSIPRIQAFLMVGLHLWGSQQGASAWIYVGIAIRMVQVLNLSNSSEYPSPEKLNVEQWIIHENKRRTFWSAYLMDRFLSNGRGRPQTLNNRDISIPLPADNTDYTYGTPEQQSRYLTSPDPPHGTLLPESTGSMASLIILVDIWSRMARWSCSRKWLTDPLAPWDPNSEFHQVSALLERWYEQLPRSLQYNDHTMVIQLAERNASYAFMHMVYFNGLLFLHRSYIPFAPTRTDPQGPKEATERGWIEPEGFWKKSARICFSASEAILSINTELCASNNSLVTPFALFSIFSASGMLAYLKCFTWMEPLTAVRAPSLFYMSIDYMKSVKSKWRMVQNWIDTLGKLHEVYLRVAREGNEAVSGNGQALPLPPFTDFERTILDFGSLHTNEAYTSNIRGEVALPERGSSVRREGSLPLVSKPPTPVLSSMAHFATPVATPALLQSPNYGMAMINGDGMALAEEGIQTMQEGGLLAFLQGDEWGDEWFTQLAAS